MNLNADSQDTLRRQKAREEFEELVRELLPYSDSDVTNDQERLELAQVRARWILLKRNWVSKYGE